MEDKLHLVLLSIRSLCDSPHRLAAPSRILAEVEAKGFVTLEALAEAFSVSMQTVRRDVIALQERG